MEDAEGAEITNLCVLCVLRGYSKHIELPILARYATMRVGQNSPYGLFFPTWSEKIAADSEPGDEQPD